MTTSPDGQLPLDPPVNLVVPDPNLPTVIPIDPDGAQPEILSSKAKAVVGAVLSILGLICGFVASYLPDPWFGIMFGLAGLFNVIGVPLGIYQTRNSVQQITLPPSHNYAGLAANVQGPGAVVPGLTPKGKHAAGD